MTFCNVEFTHQTRQAKRPAKVLREYSPGFAALFILLAGCGGGNDAAEGSAANPDQSVTAAMLTEGGIVDRFEAQEVPLVELGFEYGAREAPIKVVEFSDYGCGYCRRFHTETFPTLLEDYIETGKVHWRYVTYVSGMFQNGTAAAFVAECAGEQGFFKPVNDLLYERQGDWKNLGDPFPVFDELAREVGADVEEFNACLDERRPESRVRSGMVSGRNLGVRGTPAFVANGIPVMGAQPLEWWVEFFATIEEALAEVAAGGGEPSGQVPPP